MHGRLLWQTRRNAYVLALAPDSDTEVTALAKLHPSLAAAVTSAYAAASSCVSVASPHDDALMRETDTALALRM
jgi:hypothetical protein